MIPGTEQASAHKRVKTAPVDLLEHREHSWLDYLERHAHEDPEGAALVTIDRGVTWSKLRELSHSFAAQLYSAGVRKGNRVAILMRNGPAFVVAMLGVHLVGAIAVPVNYRLAEREVEAVLGVSGPVLLAYDDEHMDAAERLATVKRIPVLASGQHDLNFTLRGEVEGPAPTDVRSLVEHTSGSECAVIMFTSGSTGRPKGAMLSYVNLMSQVQTAIFHFKVEGSSQVTLLNSPLFHIAGLATLLRTLVTGRTLAFASFTQFEPEEFLADLQRFDVEETYLISSLWARVCKYMEARSMTHDLKNLGWGAEPAAVGTLEAMARCFPHARMVSTFGQTEMSPLTTVLEPDYALSKIGSVGTSCISTAIRVVDDQMDDVPVGQVGEAVYRGPGLMMGYWNDPDATAEALGGGWFHSGDLVRKDDEGFFYVVDRIKNIIISGGENIYTPQVEEAILLHPNVKEVAVIGTSDAKWGEVPVAAVSLVDPAVPTSEEELIEHCRAVLASYKKPRRVHVLSELPKNGSGKISKPELRQVFPG